MEDDSMKENEVLSESHASRDTESPCEPEAKKKRIVEVDLTSDDGRMSPDEGNTSMISTPGRKTPRTPKIGKEEREADRLRKLELKRQKDDEREKARLDKERIAEEKRLEKERKDRDREEKRQEEERRKEEKRKAKEEEAEKKRQEELEKQKKKDEIAAKKKEEELERLEKQKKKDEAAARKKAEEEQKKRDEQAEEEKKRRASQRFIGFFSKKEKPSGPSSETDDELWYRAFQIKPGMTIAPVLRRESLNPDDDIITQRPEVDATTYLKSDSCKKRVITASRKLELRAKLFQFHTNYRPPYYGTWRKKNIMVNPRRPCDPTAVEIDYEVDSSDDWEDEPSDAEECKSDEEDPDDGEVDSENDENDEFLVEPGYLSDGEGNDESEGGGALEVAAGVVPAGMRQHSMSSVRKLNELVHECQVQLALFRHATQGIGTAQDGASLRREVETAGRACLKACEAAKNCVLPQLRHEGVEFTRHASQFIGCVAAYVVEMKRCVALERTFPAPTEPSITPTQIANMESMLETLENLITVHFSTSESSPTDKVTPRRRRATSCRPQCVCSKLKTSYA